MDTAKKLLVASLLLLVAVQGASAWGNATHVYFAKELGVKHGPLNLNEMYGALLPDVFNFTFDAQGEYLYDATHFKFMPVYRKAWTPGLKATAIGFLTHNGTWGADYTAHKNAFTFRHDGYAVAKGVALSPQLIPVLVEILHNAGLPSPDADYIASQLAPAMGHDLSETAVDLLVRRNLDPGIGASMVQAAQTRPPEVPQLLVAAFARDFARKFKIPEAEAAGLIVGTEAWYQGYMIDYGTVFTLDEPTTIAMLAAQTAPVAESLIESNVPGFDVTVTPEQVAQFITAAIAIVEPDYAREIARTMHFVERNLRDNNISDGCGGFAHDADGSTVQEADGLTTPTEFSLAQNYPNPFNPSTTISFALPADGLVSLRVYNTLGEEVATLVNDVMPAGQHQAVWNAAGMPSGLYFYKIENAGVTATKRMMLVK
jgi:hypothetical protein